MCTNRWYEIWISILYKVYVSVLGAKINTHEYLWIDQYKTHHWYMFFFWKRDIVKSKSDVLVILQMDNFSIAWPCRPLFFPWILLFQYRKIRLNMPKFTVLYKCDPSYGLEINNSKHSYYHKDFRLPWYVFL